MKIGKMLRIGAGVVLSIMFVMATVNSGAPVVDAADSPNHYHKAVAEGFIGTLSKYFMAGYDWVENNVMYYTGKAGGYVYDHTNPCTTQNCNK